MPRSATMQNRFILKRCLKRSFTATTVVTSVVLMGHISQQIVLIVNDHTDDHLLEICTMILAKDHFFAKTFSTFTLKLDQSGVENSNSVRSRKIFIMDFINNETFILTSIFSYQIVWIFILNNLQNILEMRIFRRKRHWNIYKVSRLICFK